MRIPGCALAAAGVDVDAFDFGQTKHSYRCQHCRAELERVVPLLATGPGWRWLIRHEWLAAMLEKARRNAALIGLSQVQFRRGLAEALPVADETADIVLSNGVINLCPDKEQAYAETFRVLKPGGRLQIADIVVAHEVPRDAREDISLWTG